MNILIIEDDELKTGRIRSFLESEIPGASIEVARSYKSGLRGLVAAKRDLVVLDMSLPTFDIQPGGDGGRPLSLGGQELLRQMNRRRILYPTIVVTGFDAFGSSPDIITFSRLSDDLVRDFGHFYLGGTYFNATTDDWRDSLRPLIAAVKKV